MRTMLSLYRAWLGPGPSVSRPAPPPGAHRPVPRRPHIPEAPQRAITPPRAPSSASSVVDVERVESPGAPAVLDVAACDGPVRFSRVLNTAWREAGPAPARAPRRAVPPHTYPCKTCGCKFPSYYFVHKHRKHCHPEEQVAEEADDREAEFVT